MSLLPHEDYSLYPESPLNDRHKLAYDWIPGGCHRLLDGGCAFGYGTRHFLDKAAEVYGIDPNEEFVAIAKARYPQIVFYTAGLERMPFEREFFDVIVMNDSFEHVRNEQVVLNEAYRVLKPGGLLIMTTPHQGLFAFMDPENFVYHLRTKTPMVYRWLFRAKYGKYPEKVKLGYEELHRHYSLEELRHKLDESNFRDRYEIDRVFRGGMLVGVLAANLFEFFSVLFGIRVANILLKPLFWLQRKDYFISYGTLSHNIGIRLKKC